MKPAYRIINPATGLPTETQSYSGVPSGEASAEPAGPVGSLALATCSLVPSAGQRLWIVKAWGNELRLLKPEAAVDAVREFLADGATLICVEVCESPAPENAGHEPRAGELPSASNPN